MPLWLQAFGWGAIAGGALVLGAAIAWKWTVPPRIVSFVMAFGAGVLISALAFELVGEAQEAGGLVPTAGGFLVGAVTYVGANAILARKGAQHRKRSGGQQPSESDAAGSGNAIALGALLDGIPESVVLGLGLVAGGTVNPAVLAAIVSGRTWINGSLNDGVIASSKVDVTGNQAVPGYFGIALVAVAGVLAAATAGRSSDGRLCRPACAVIRPAAPSHAAHAPRRRSSGPTCSRSQRHP